MEDGPTDLVSLLQGKTVAVQPQPGSYKLTTGIGDFLTSVANFFLGIAGFFVRPLTNIIISIAEGLSLDTVPLLELGHELLVVINKYFTNIGTSGTQAPRLYYVN